MSPGRVLAAGVLVALLGCDAGLEAGGSSETPLGPEIVASPVALQTIDAEPASTRPAEVSVDVLAHLVIFITHDCPIANQYVPEMQALAADHPDVAQFLVHVDPDASPEELREHRLDYGLPGTVLHDPRHELVRDLEAKVTPEAFLIGQGGVLAYRGRIDDLYPELGTKRRKARERNLRDAIGQLRNGEPIERAATVAVGCRIPELPPEVDSGSKR